MAKSKRNRRAKNAISGSTIGGSADGALIQADATIEPAVESALIAMRPNVIVISRETLFTAELEEVIEIIAKDRVWRAMRARLRNPRLIPPAAGGDILDG